MIFLLPEFSSIKPVFNSKSLLPQSTPSLLSGLMNLKLLLPPGSYMIIKIFVDYKIKDLRDSSFLPAGITSK
jgi:hypothetical protein